jgi:hypothetical protein
MLTRTSVISNAPEESGVYGLCSLGTWLYIGQSSNIRKALVEYVSGQMPHKLESQPKLFALELHPYERRIARHKELVAHFQPIVSVAVWELYRLCGYR